ncbi:hypothetical protein Tco_0115141 [Tanacetum coccineum]
MMSTLVFVDPNISTQDNGAQTSRVPVPLPDDPYVAVRQARLVDTKSELEEAPSEGEELQSLGYKIPLMGEEFIVVEPSGTRTDSSHSSASLDSTPPLSPDHLLTYVSPTPTPTRASFHSKTMRMTMRAQPVMSLGHSATVTEAMALLDSVFPKSEEDEIGEEDNNKDKSHGLDDEGNRLDDQDHSLDDEGRSLDEEGLGLKESKEEAVPKDQQWGALVVETAVEPERPERVSALRQPTLTTWIDPEDGIAYIDVPSYLPPAPPAQTPPSPEWSSGSLPVSPAPSIVPSPIPLSMILLTVPLTIVSPVATPTATISIDEDQFIEVGVQLELLGVYSMTTLIVWT